MRRGMPWTDVEDLAHGLLVEAGVALPADTGQAVFDRLGFLQIQRPQVMEAITR